MKAYTAFVACHVLDDNIVHVTGTRCFPTLLEASEWAWAHAQSGRTFTEHCWVEFEGQEVKPEDGWHSIFPGDQDVWTSSGWCEHWGKPTKGEWI